MKHLALALLALCVLCPVSCSAQTKLAAAVQNEKQPSTALEAFMGKRGKMIVKDFYSLGKIAPSGMALGRVDMDALVIYEPGNPEKIKGLRIEVTEAGQFERSSTAFVDYDELESLSQALAYTSDLASKWSGRQHSPYTEVTYVSKGDLQIGFYQKDKEAKAYCRAGEVGTTTAYLGIAALSQLKALVDQAVTLLKEK